MRSSFYYDGHHLKVAEQIKTHINASSEYEQIRTEKALLSLQKGFYFFRSVIETRWFLTADFGVLWLFLEKAVELLCLEI